MSETTVNLGMLPNNRGSYTSETWTQNPPTIYKDNIVEFNNSAYIYNPVSFSIDNPAASATTNPPYDAATPTVLNTGWHVFASGNNTFTTGEKVDNVGIDNEPTAESENLVKSGGVKNQIEQLDNKISICSTPSFAGAYKKVIEIAAGSSHSSDNDRILVDIKQGTQFKVIFNSSSRAIVYVKYGELTTSVALSGDATSSGIVFTATNDITSLGVYFTATQTETVEFIVLVDFMNKLDNASNLNKALLFKENNVAKITYDNSGITIPTGIIVRYHDLSEGTVKAYVVESDTTISTDYKGQWILTFNTKDNSFGLATNTIYSYIKENVLYVCSFDNNRMYSDLPVDFDGSSSFNDTIEILKESAANSNSLLYSISKQTDSPIALNARIAVFNNIKFYKGLKYKFSIDITYDNLREHTINISGLFKEQAYGTPISAVFSVSSIPPTSSHVDGYFIPSETFEGNGCFVVADYSYNASNKQYASVILECTDANNRLNILDNKVESLENGMEDSFLGRTREQFVRVRQLGYALKTSVSFPYVPDGYIPQLSFMHISDTHGGTDDSHRINSENAIKALNLLSTSTSNYGNQVKFLIHTGDIKDHAFDSNFSYWTSARALANKPVYHVIGNHDVGFQKAVADAGTDAQVYNVMISPFLSEWQLKSDGLGTPHPTDKNYYFTDFTDEKIRLIVLYEYETEFELDPNNNTQLLYARGYRAFRQAQIDWFIESLMTTPAEYGVIVAKHQMEDYNDGNVNPFNSPLRKDTTGQSMTFVPVYMIADIVEAFRNGTSINETYSQTGGCSTSYPTLSAVADFSNKNIGAEFICYLSGHTHCDEIHYVKKYPNQLELTIGCNNTTYTAYSDMNQIINSLSQDVINVYAVDRNIGVVNIVRIGSNLSNTMQKRDVLSLPYRQ